MVSTWPTCIETLQVAYTSIKEVDAYISRIPVAEEKVAQIEPDGGSGGMGGRGG
jgi:hypothetical protein